MRIDQVRLLGSDISSTQTVGDPFQEKIDLLQMMEHRLHLLQAQNALLLLCHSTAILKVFFNLHISPCFISMNLFTTHYQNCSSAGTTWPQATGCTILAYQILPPPVQDTPDPSVEAALANWSLDHDLPPPLPPTHLCPAKSLGCS